MKKILRGIKKILLKFQGPHIQHGGSKTKRFGNDYGGFDVVIDHLPQQADAIIYSFGMEEIHVLLALQNVKVALFKNIVKIYEYFVKNTS